jgi:hypothetical protein
MARIGKETVEIVRFIDGGDGGWHGEGEGETETEAMPGCAVIPRGSQENVDRANTVVTGITVFAPFAGPRPTPTEKIFVRGHLWQMVGEVGEYINRAGKGKAVQFAAERVAG